MKIRASAVMRVVGDVLRQHNPGGNTEADISCSPCDEARWPQGFGNSIQRGWDGPWDEHFLTMLAERLEHTDAHGRPTSLRDSVEGWQSGNASPR
jgi:hypothetical protein